MFDVLVVVAVAAIGFVFLKSKYKKGSGIISQPSSNTTEGKRDRILEFLIIAMMVGVVVFVQLRSPNKGLFGFLFLVLSASIMVFISRKTSKKK